MAPRLREQGKGQRPPARRHRRQGRRRVATSSSTAARSATASPSSPPSSASLEQERQTQRARRRDLAPRRAGRLHQRRQVDADARAHRAARSTSPTSSSRRSTPPCARSSPETRPRILVSDTVGFIKKLPHGLVASFKSTLDEALEASLLAHVVDASDPGFERQLEVTARGARRDRRRRRAAPARPQQDRSRRRTRSARRRPRAARHAGPTRSCCRPSARPTSRACTPALRGVLRARPGRGGAARARGTASSCAARSSPPARCSRSAPRPTPPSSACAPAARRSRASARAARRPRRPARPRPPRGGGRRGRERGELAGDVGVEGADAAHVGRDVAGRHQHRADPADLPSVVEERADDRHPRAARDVIEARLPVRRAAPRPRRRNHEVEPVDRVEAIDHLLHEVLPRAPVDGQAAEPPHQPAERPAEELAFPEPRRPEAEHPRDREHERQVPVRGVRRGDDDGPRRARQTAFDAPAGEPEVERPDTARDAAGAAGRRHPRS